MSNNTKAGRCVVVTGAAGGIGQGIVESFLATGDTVIAVDAGAEALSLLRSNFEASSKQLLIIKGDVTMPASWAEIAAVTVATEAEEIILVNNAGISPKRDGTRIPGVEIPYEEWSRVLEVNLTGPFLGIQALAPLMKEAKFGRIINMSSLAGRDGGRLGGAHYAATKTGLLGVTRYFARELAPDGITVNAIAPGRIGVGMVGSVSDDVNNAYLSRIPVGRLGSSDDVAQAVQYLAASDNGFVTGVTIDVNGGSYMG